MSASSLCRVCLVNNMNLYSVRNDLQNAYERIAREEFNKDGYPVRMCSICLTVLRKCHRFMETAQDSNNALKLWCDQQNEIRVARPLYTYTRSEVELLFNKIEEEKVEIEVKQIQPEYPECAVVNIQKRDIDEQSDCSGSSAHSPNNTYTDTADDTLNIEYNDRQTDPLLNNKIEEKYLLALNLDDHANIETRIKTSPTDNENQHTVKVKQEKHMQGPLTVMIVPPIKKENTNETQPFYQTPGPSRQTATNSQTFNYYAPLTSTPYQPYITPIKTKPEPTFYKNNSKETPKLKKTKTKTIRKRIDKSLGRAARNRYRHHFVCDICNFQCTTKIILIMHIKHHDDSRPHLCDVCGGTFRCAGSLKNHKAFKHKIGITQENLSDSLLGLPEGGGSSETPKTNETKTQANISVEQRRRIVTLHNRGFNISEIAKEANCTRNTVRLWVKRFEGEGSVLDRSRSGRPRRIEPAQLREMVEECDGITSIPTKTFAERYGISVETVRRLLRREGVRLSTRRKPNKKQSNITNMSDMSENKRTSSELEHKNNTN